jgi:hypothetical protein
MQSPVIIPVIHYQNNLQTLRNTATAFREGCDRVMLINMDGPGLDMLYVYKELKRFYPNKKIGVNFLESKNPNSMPFNILPDLDMTWTDIQFTHSQNQLEPECTEIKRLLSEREHNHDFFCGVAFKHQPLDPNPINALRKAHDLGFIPTTSGSATGVPADPLFVKQLYESMDKGKPLAIASGITPDNVNEFLPYVSHILVSTGISGSFYEFDSIKITDLLDVVNDFEKKTYHDHTET